MVCHCALPQIGHWLTFPSGVWAAWVRDNVFYSWTSLQGMLCQEQKWACGVRGRLSKVQQQHLSPSAQPLLVRHRWSGRQESKGRRAGGHAGRSSGLPGWPQHTSSWLESRLAPGGCRIDSCYQIDSHYQTKWSETAAGTGRPWATSTQSFACYEAQLWCLLSLGRWVPWNPKNKRRIKDCKVFVGVVKYL